MVATRLPRRLMALAAAFLALTFMLVLVGPAWASGSTAQTNVPFDISPLLKDRPAPVQAYPNGEPGAAALAAQPTHDGRAPDLVLTLFDFDPAHGGSYEVPFWKEASGLHSDIYVAWNDLQPPPESSQQSHEITPAQIQYMADEFDQRIWESDVFHFGNYEPRAPEKGMDGSRAGIFVYNIRDEAYWGDYRFYTAGYFWSSLNDYLNINAIFIDSFDWANRTGPDSARPYLYEGTIAHEFEHLIHHDVDPDEDSFIDEGMADLAEQFIYGTITTDSHIGNYLVYHRDSLTDWDGELYDYGNGVLWQDYLWEAAGGDVLNKPLDQRLAKKTAGKKKAAEQFYDKFADDPAKFTDPGDRFVWNLIHDQENGLASVANWVVGGRDRVEGLHHDYTLANLLDGKVTEQAWNYRNLALGGPDSDGYTIDDGIDYYNAKVGGNMPPTRKNVWRRTTTEAWGAYYRTYSGSQPGFTLSFTGPAGSGVAPFTGTYEWYSGLGNALQRTLERRLDDVPANGVLEFMTWFDIEQDWDYGYVEASANGSPWTKLEQLSSLPAGLSNTFGSSAWDGEGGLTGSSGGWQMARFDLSGFSGTVDVRFRYATDEAVNGLGWYVDDLAVPGSSNVFPLDSVESQLGWVTNGWVFTTGLQNNDWTADVYLSYAKARQSWYQVSPVVGTAGEGTVGQAWVDAQYLKDGRAYGVISNRPDGAFDAVGRLELQK